MNNNTFITDNKIDYYYYCSSDEFKYISQISDIINDRQMLDLTFFPKFKSYLIKKHSISIFIFIGSLHQNHIQNEIVKNSKYIRVCELVSLFQRKCIWNRMHWCNYKNHATKAQTRIKFIWKRIWCKDGNFHMLKPLQSVTKTQLKTKYYPKMMSIQTKQEENTTV